MLTFDAGYFSSQTAIDAFRIGWITSRNAFESFFDTYIMANSIKMVIPREVGLNDRFPISQDRDRSEITTCPVKAVPTLMIVGYLRTVWVNLFMDFMGKAQPYEK